MDGSARALAVGTSIAHLDPTRPGSREDPGLLPRHSRRSSPAGARGRSRCHSIRRYPPKLRKSPELGQPIPKFRHKRVTSVSHYSGADRVQQVDLWIWGLDDPVPARVVAALSDEERTRALRFAAPLHASRFVSARAGLRGILARYVGLPPGALQFSYGPHGKPALCGTHRPVPHFNLSHSGRLAALGLCWNSDLGIDIELIRPIEENVAGLFSTGEQQALAELSGVHALRRFYQIWTCKEALLKGLGSGLAVPLDRFEISIVPDQPALVLDLDGDLKAACQWQLCQFEPASDFVGALAIPAQLSLRLIYLASICDVCA